MPDEQIDPVVYGGDQAHGGWWWWLVVLSVSAIFFGTIYSAHQKMDRENHHLIEDAPQR